MSNTVQFSMKLPADLAGKIEEIARKTDRSKSAVAASLIRKGLSDGPGPKPATADDAAEIRKRLSAIESAMREDGRRRRGEIEAAVLAALRASASGAASPATAAPAADAFGRIVTLDDLESNCGDPM